MVCPPVTAGTTPSSAHARSRIRLPLRPLSTVGKHFSENSRTAAEIKVCADAMAGMFCAYLESLRHD
jgi:hypothetical protein